MNLTLNLMSKFHYKYKKIKYYSLWEYLKIAARKTPVAF